MPSTLSFLTIDTPLGLLELQGTPNGLQAIGFVEQRLREDAALQTLWQAADQLREYFSGTRKHFADLPLQSVGTEFQQRVWDAAAGIGWGETLTYGQLAKEIGDADAARAVGTALGRNPLCIIVPCHRIVAANGDGGGYAWGQWRKDWLLNHERN